MKIGSIVRYIHGGMNPYGIVIILTSSYITIRKISIQYENERLNTMHHYTWTYGLDEVIEV